MDLKEIRKITSYAKKSGVKSIKVDGLEVEFYDRPEAPRIAKRKPQAVEAPGTVPAPVKEPTLAEINDWIYRQDEAV